MVCVFLLMTKVRVVAPAAKLAFPACDAVIEQVPGATVRTFELCPCVTISQKESVLLVNTIGLKDAREVAVRVSSPLARVIAAGWVKLIVCGSLLITKEREVVAGA